MSAFQKAYRQITCLIPDLDDWSQKAARFDGSAPEALKFCASGFMDLNVDILHRNASTCRIALSHYYKHESGDMIADPDMEVLVDFDGKMAFAMTYQDSFGSFQRIEDRDDSLGLTEFLCDWLSNIESQGHKQAPAS